MFLIHYKKIIIFNINLVLLRLFIEAIESTLIFKSVGSVRFLKK